MSSSVASVVVIRYAARSSRIRVRNRVGDSPAIAAITRSKWNRDRCAAAAISSARAGIASRSTASRSTKATNRSGSLPGM